MPVKKRPPLRTAPKNKPSSLDEFAAAAGEPLAGDRGAQEYPWEHPRVREDVTKPVIFRVPEPVYLKLKFIAQNTRHTMTSFILDRILEDIDKEIERLTGDR